MCKETIMEDGNYKYATEDYGKKFDDVCSLLKKYEEVLRERVKNGTVVIISEYKYNPHDEFLVFFRTRRDAETFVYDVKEYYKRNKEKFTRWVDDEGRTCISRMDLFLRKLVPYESIVKDYSLNPLYTWMEYRDTIDEIMSPFYKSIIILNEK